MTGGPKDDVPASPSRGGIPDEDGDPTTAHARAPARSEDPPTDETEENTVRGPAVVSAPADARPAPLPAAGSPAKAGPPRRATPLGFPPPPAPAPSPAPAPAPAAAPAPEAKTISSPALVPPSSSSVVEDPASTAPLPDLDDREDSITTASPVVAGISPLTPDSTESLEETEVKTLTAVSPVQPAAGKPLGPAPRPVVPETKAPALAPQVAAASAAPIPITAVPSTASPVSPRLSMPGSSVPTPKPSPSPFTGSDADDDGVITEARGDLRAKQAPTPPIPESDPDDESVTTRASAFSDDSVTHEAPVVTKDGPPKDGPSLRADGVPIVHEDDSNDAVTMLNPRSPSAPSSPALPAEEEGESITTQAPGHLTNMLRVIAAETPASGARAVDASLQNETAVMVGAPVKNPASEARQPGAGPAQGGEVLSDSALRLERPDGPGTDRGSLGSLRAAGAQPRTANDLALARTEPLFGQSPASGSFHEVPATKSPRYGLLVGVVAAISILVPVVLFVVLKSNAEAPPRGSPAQPISDMVRRTDPLRAKAPRNVPSSSPASSSKPGPARWPFHRR